MVSSRVVPSDVVENGAAAATPLAEPSWEPLLDIESGLAFMDEPGITTATFFHVEDGPTAERAVAALRKRVEDICAKNPWLTGRVVRDRKRHKNLVLEFSEPATNADVDAIFEVTDAPELTGLNDSDEAEHILKTVALSSATIPVGRKVVGTQTRVSKVTLAKSASDATVLILIVSLSHLVADGHTYYELFSMLDLNTPVKTLRPQRKEESYAAVPEAMGRKEYQYMFAPSMMVNATAKMLCGPKAKVHVMAVDEGKVAASKAAATSGFISTNDIITSSFAKAARSRIVMMAINWRNRLVGFQSDDAGNYEGVLVYDPESYAKPELIRASLLSGPPFRRQSDRPLPGFCEGLTCRYSMITNWAFSSFNGDIPLLSDAETTIRLHLPILRPEWGCWPYAIIFHARKNTKAVMYLLPDVTVEQLMAAGSPLGEPLL